MDTESPTPLSDSPLSSQVRVLGPQDGDILGAAESVRDRFMLHGSKTYGRFALVEHFMPPKTLAAPLHRHSQEDEYSYVLEGTVGAIFGNEEVVGTTGDLIFKPRGEWHTFWNAGDVPARILEIISPGGFERAFEEMHALGEGLTPETMVEIGQRYGAEVDFEATLPLMERHRLKF